MMHFARVITSTNIVKWELDEEFLEVPYKIKQFKESIRPPAPVLEPDRQKLSEIAKNGDIRLVVHLVDESKRYRDMYFDTLNYVAYNEDKLSNSVKDEIRKLVKQVIQEDLENL